MEEVRERLLTVQEYAKVFDISIQGVYKRISRGAVKTKKIFGRIVIIVE